MKISIVMTHWNRRVQLYRTLVTISRLYSEYDYEVIIVDDASNKENNIKDFEDFPNVKVIEITEKESLVKSRIGQGKFRDDVLELHQKCPFTQITNPKLLRAGHLKPWAECDNRERLDPYNGLALTPTFDLLVDRGYLSFENNGDLILSSTLTQNEISQLELPVDFRLEIVTNSQRLYIQYHRTEIFKI